MWNRILSVCWGATTSLYVVNTFISFQYGNQHAFLGWLCASVAGVVITVKYLTEWK